MQKFIRKNKIIIDGIHSLLLVCFVIANYNRSIFSSPIFIPLVVVTLGSMIILSYFEDVENRKECIVSQEYKEKAIHSFFNPFTWEKEWSHHFKYFLILIKRRKIFNPFYLMGYILILLPTRIWINYVFFYYPHTLVSVILTLLYLSYLYSPIFGFMKFGFTLLFCSIFIGNFYLLGVKTLHDRNSYFRQKIADLCVDKDCSYFFLGNTFFNFNWKALFNNNTIVGCGSILGAIGGTAMTLHYDELDVETRRSNMLKNNIDIKKSIGERISYQEELNEVKKTLKPFPERVMDTLFSKKNDK